MKYVKVKGYVNKIEWLVKKCDKSTEYLLIRIKQNVNIEKDNWSRSL